MKIERITRSAPSSCFQGGHTVQHRVVSDDRQWMRYRTWAVIGLLGAALIIGAMPLPAAPAVALRAEPVPVSSTSPLPSVSQKENGL